MPKVILYRWRVTDPVTGRRYTTRYHATEESIRQAHHEAQPVPGSREERDVLEGDFPGGLSAGHVQRGPEYADRGRPNVKEL
jgi:hypothetical protein